MVYHRMTDTTGVRRRLLRVGSLTKHFTRVFGSQRADQVLAQEEEARADEGGVGQRHRGRVLQRRELQLQQKVSA